jgi:hypothetical protein
MAHGFISRTRHPMRPCSRRARESFNSMLTEFGSEFLVKFADYLPRSCGNMKLSRCDAEDPLEVTGKLALIREPDA